MIILNLKQIVKMILPEALRNIYTALTDWDTDRVFVRFFS